MKVLLAALFVWYFMGFTASQGQNSTTHFGPFTTQEDCQVIRTVVVHYGLNIYKITACWEVK